MGLQGVLYLSCFLILFAFLLGGHLKGAVEHAVEQNKSTLGREPIPKAVVSVSRNLVTKLYSLEDAKKYFPQYVPDEMQLMENSKSEKTFYVPITSSANPNEFDFPFAKLRASCPILKFINVSLIFRVDEQGKVTDIAPVVPDMLGNASLSKFSGCRFLGGPTHPFTTEFWPNLQTRSQ